MRKQTTSRWWGRLGSVRAEPKPGTGVRRNERLCYPMQLLSLGRQWLFEASVDPHYSRNSDRHPFDNHYHIHESTAI